MRSKHGLSSVILAVSYDCFSRERAAAIRAARVARLDAHKIHTICLIANARVRNQWLNDPLLHVSYSPICDSTNHSFYHRY